MNKLETQFQRRVWSYYRANNRSMPWRETHDLYSVLVSEIMLQQTQVNRVIPKFVAFTEQFPTLQELSRAPLADVVIAWQGLGYNRRAKYLHEAAKKLVTSEVPETIDQLVMLPGVGANTAAAICAYVYNQPVIFIETNIRTVYIHEFFQDRTDVADKEILEIVTRTLDHANPREWYWALMDYGTYLKSQKLGSITRSSAYVKQSAFHGSVRQARGDILRRLASGPVDAAEIQADDERYPRALQSLVTDGLVEQHDGVVCLTAHSQES